MRGDALRVAANAAPSNGAANIACVVLLAKKLGVERRSVDLALHSKNRRKRVQIRGDPAALTTRLMELAAENWA